MDILHKPFAQKIVSSVSRYYLIVLLLALVSAYFSFDLAKTLKLDTNITALMPDGVPSVDNLQKVISKTGGYANAMVLVESPDSVATIRFLEKLRAEVLTKDWASSAEFVEDTSIFQSNRLLYVDVEDLNTIDRRLADRIEYEKNHIKFHINETEVNIEIRGSAKTVPSLDFSDIENKYTDTSSKSENNRNLFRNDDGNLTIMVVLPKGGTTTLNYSRKVVKEIEATIERLNPLSYHPQMTVQVGGRVANRVAKFDAVIKDVSGSLGWSLAAIFLLVVLFYRRIMAVVYIGLPLIIGFLWTFGLTQLTLGGLNLITIFLSLILFGLGIDFGIHNLARYDEVRKLGGDIQKALGTVVFKTGHASIMAALTTMIGFYSLMTTDFRAFYEFGFIAGTGVALTFFSMYVVFPALMVLAERLRIYRLPKGWSGIATNRQRRFPFVIPILVISSIFTLGSLFVVSDVEFERDFNNLETRVPRMSALNEKIKEVFPLRSDKAVVYVDTLREVDALVEAVEEIRGKRGTENPTIEKVRSILSVLPSSEDQSERLVVIDRIQEQLVEAIQLLEEFGSSDDKRKRDLEELLEFSGATKLKPEDLPEAVQRIYRGASSAGGYLVYIYNKKEVAKLDDAEAFVDDIREIKIDGKIYYPATEAMIFVDMLNLMKKDAADAVGAVLIAIFFVLVLLFGKLKHVAVVLTPIALGMIWMLGAMVLLDIKLNVFNMVVLPTVLGIGIDNSIHIFHRYREEGGGRVWHVIRTTGSAAFLTTLTTMMGFAGTLTASNRGLQSLGLLACIGLGTCLISSLTVLPALLQLVHDRRRSDAAPS